MGPASDGDDLHPKRDWVRISIVSTSARARDKGSFGSKIRVGENQRSK